MTGIPFDMGPIHFIGIGGIGMSGIAEVMLNLGYKVQGSDQRESPIVQRLRSMGATVHIGHAPENVAEASVIVVSSAIKDENVELAAARGNRLPVVRRAEMLAELMRLKLNVAVAGTHGKTTTTSLVATLLDAGGIDPTVINGGIIQSYGSNARKGEGEWMVVEADESDGTFVKLPATIGVITNIDPEHMEHYGSFDNLRAAFLRFVENIPFYGAAVCCIDHPEVQALIGRVKDRKIITYGFSPQADIRVVNLRYELGTARFDVELRNGTTRLVEGFSLPIPGDHNVLNALAAIGVARQLGISDDAIRDGLAGFAGVKRRFTHVGDWNGIRIIDDYGHHPVEIAAVLKAARASTQGRIIAIHQPHRFTRLSHLFEDFCNCFNDADVAVIADVYTAGEDPIEGADRDSLVAGLTERGHRRALKIDGPEDLPALIAAEAQPGDMVVCLGAGSITTWANELAEALGEHERAA